MDFTYLGHNFTLLYEGGRASGVVSREGADIHADDYLEALKAAHEAYKQFLNYIFINHHIGYKTERFSAEECEHLLQKMKVFFNQSYLPIPNQFFAFAKALQVRQAVIEAKAEKERLRISRAKPGYVYLLQSPTGYYKIGRTKDPNDRIKTFGVKLPFEVEYTCLIQTQDMYKLESDLHEMFSQKRVNGEWFSLDATDVDQIKGLAS